MRARAGVGAGEALCAACLSPGRLLEALDSLVAPLYAALLRASSERLAPQSGEEGPESGAVRACWECRAALRSTLRFQQRAGRARRWLEAARTRHPDVLHFSIAYERRVLVPSLSTVKPLSTLQSSVKSTYDVAIYWETISELGEESSHFKTEPLYDIGDNFVSFTTECDGSHNIKTEESDQDIVYSSGSFNRQSKSKKRKTKKDQDDKGVVYGAVFADGQQFKKSKMECENVSKTESQDESHPHSNENQRRIKPSYQCNHCNKLFKNRAALTGHHKEEHYKYQCDYCRKTFSCYLRIKRHLLCYTQASCVKNKRIGKSLRPVHECDDCGTKFTYRCNLTDHMRTHTGERPYECLECKKKYTQIASLNRHLRVHKDDKRYKCSFCGQCFLERRSLTDHYNTHTGVRPYLCSECGKTFTQRAALRTHAKIHTSVPFECNDCGKKFRTQGSFNTHCTSHRHVDSHSKMND